MIDKVNHYSLLYDFYGQLLTEKQQDFFELYYHQDWSLGEIAVYYEVSRTAVHDLLKRVEKILDNYEKKLMLVSRFKEIDKELQLLLQLVDGAGEFAKPVLAKDIRQKIISIIELSRG
ncbi:MAG: YlxM family DNA-binding protein [Bacillota bacterium]|nr:YlxM family DNA-binding protein [Bacillota bacterium]